MSYFAGRREPLLSKQAVRLRDDMRRMRIRSVLRRSIVLRLAGNSVNCDSKTHPQQSLRSHYFMYNNVFLS